MAELPIVVLAFANDQAGRQYLRDLPKELRSLQEIFQGAERDGLCRLELLPNADLDQVFRVFTENRDRVAIFHYAGHADSGRLLLESGDAGGAAAHAEGLATFLGQRRGLQLVFLNGCSTRAQVAGLLDAGVAAVIATARDIEDEMARGFAVAFYTELASGTPLAAAYDAARGRVQAARGADAKAYVTRRKMSPESETETETESETSTGTAGPELADDRGFPWEFRAGDERVGLWSLPDAAANPEFGLPPVPDRDLPESPFLGLNWFTAEHSGVFFGRGYQVRELYQQITDPAAPPVLLLYGASGVGKSSLLDAGLVPRLESGGSAVRYRRRDQPTGLTATLRDALGLTGDTALSDGWRAEETRAGSPLVVVLDQVEEVFTRSDPSRPRELDEFLAALGELFSDREARPRGKLVLGFRKEWLAEIDGRMAEARLSRARVFVKPLDRRGIVAAILGAARPGRHQRQYRLAIEEGLPEVIADDLLTDAGSALAPTLQVLLTQMWSRASKANPDGPRFDRALYESLKSQGYLLEDVLEGGLKAIGRWNPAVVESGLALDVLEYHTTDLGTASQHTRAELDARYAHQAGLLDGLLGCGKDHYLIIEADPGSDPATAPTRLAHDLLAPLVQRRFRLSNAPGQRARRLLVNRAPEWGGGKTGHELDGADLSVVLEGTAGMRVWDEDEARLVEASRLAEARAQAAKQEQERRVREAEEQQRRAVLERQAETERRLEDQKASNLRLREGATRLTWALSAAAAVALIAAGAAWVAAQQRRAAVTATGVARAKTKDAEKATAKAVEATRKERVQAQLATDRLRTATSRRLSALSATERTNRLDRSLLLAAAAFQTENTPEARSSLLNALQDRPGLLTYLHMDKESVSSVAFSPDGGTVAVGYSGRGGAGGGVVLWDAATRKRLAGGLLNVKEGDVRGVAFSPDGKTVAAAYAGGLAGGVVLWDAATRKRVAADTLLVDEGSVSGVAFSPDGKAVAAGYHGMDGGGVVLWDAAARTRLAGAPLPVKEGGVRGVAFSPDGKAVAAGYYAGGRVGGGVVLWDAATRKRVADGLLPVKEGGVESLAFSPDGKAVAVGYDGGLVGGVVLWDAAARKRLTDAPLPVAEGHVSSVAFSPDGKAVAAGYDGVGVGGGVVRWDVASRKRLADTPFRVTEGDVRGVAFSPDGKAVAAAYAAAHDGGVTVWDTAARHRLADEPLPVKEGGLRGVTFSPDGRTVAAGYYAYGGSGAGVVLWDAATRKRLADAALPVKEGQVRGVAFSPDGRSIAASYDDGSGGGVVLWDAAARTRLAGEPLPVAEGQIQTVAFSPDGKTLAAGMVGRTSPGGVVLWDAASHRRLDAAPLPVGEGMVRGVAFSPDGKTLAGGCNAGAIGDGGVVLWDAATRRRLIPDPLPVDEGGVSSLAFSPDGKTIAAGSEGVRGGLVLWDAATRKRLADDPLPVKEGEVQSVAFSPDGKVIATGYAGAEDGGVVLWDAAARTRLADAPLPVKAGNVQSVAFSPDGKTVAAGYDGGRVLGGGVVLWDVDLESWQRRAGQIANRNFTRKEWRESFPDEPYRATFPDLPVPADETPNPTAPPTAG